MECHDFDKAEIEHAIKGAPEDIAEWNEVDDLDKNKKRMLS
jgi:hypothetical protein